MITNDHLVEIPPDQWPRLRDMYRRDWPANIIGCYTVDTFLRWIEQSTAVKHVAIYSLNGDWDDDGTYVCVVSVSVDLRIYMPPTAVQCSTKSFSKSSASARLFKKLKHILDFNKYTISASLSSIRQHIEPSSGSTAPCHAAATRLDAWLQGQHTLRSIPPGRAVHNYPASVQLRLRQLDPAVLPTEGAGHPAGYNVDITLRSFDKCCSQW